ncbi:MAG: hypothetical protein M3198_12445 [Actinomycetota bacterium]|nr:hypothetical protein [Actinomycetota bacterium]
MKAFIYTAGALVALAVTLYPLTLNVELLPLGYLAALAFLAFALALASSEWVLAGPGTAMLVAEYAVALETADVALDRAAPVLAIGVLVLLETIDLITVVSRRPAVGREVIVAHVRHALVVTFVGAAIAGAALLAAQTVGGGPRVLVALAAASGVVAVTIAVTLAHRAVEGDA